MKTNPCIFRRQRCLTRAAKHEPQNVNILKELRNLTKLAQEQDSGGGATDAAAGGGASAAGAGRAAADADTEGTASAGDKRKCPRDSEET